MNVDEMCWPEYEGDDNEDENELEDADEDGRVTWNEDSKIGVNCFEMLLAS